MVLQMAHSREPSMTPRVLAGVRLLPSVNAQVSVQVPLLTERLPALLVRTHKRPLPRLFRL
jgi:hypothetical protein